MRRKLVFALAASLAAAAPAAPATFQDGLALYRHAHLDEARATWEEALERDPRDRRLLAYLAETYRRQGQSERASEYAERTLRLDSCDTHALNVLADLHNPHFETVEDTSFDQTQRYLARAAACDSADGNTWFDVYVLATRAGDRRSERAAVRWMGKSGILTPAVLAYARWTLQDLPRQAILLTNGDMDTYPERVLQEEEGFRADVGVVNVSLLEDPRYARVMAKRLGLPFVDMTETPPADTAEAGLTPAWRLVRRWISDVETKKLGRPFAIATTVELSFRPPDPRLRFQDWEHIRYAGPYYYFLPGERGQEFPDTSRLRANLQRVPVAAFRGSWADESDTSPIHHASTGSLRSNIASMGLIYASAFAASGQEAPLREAIDWLKRYASESGMDMNPALFDSVFQRMRAEMGAEPGAEPKAEAPRVREPAPVMSSPSDPGDPKPGDYVYVEELPEAITKVPPSYPEEARQKGIQGTVVVQALVGEYGVVKNTYVTRSVPGLDRAAEEAVRQWTFKPAKAKGKPIAVWVAVPVRFTLH